MHSKLSKSGPWGRVLIKALPPSNERAAVDESCIVAAYHLKLELEQGSEIMQRKHAEKQQN